MIFIEPRCETDVIDNKINHFLFEIDITNYMYILYVSCFVLKIKRQSNVHLHAIAILS